MVSALLSLFLSLSVSTADLSPNMKFQDFKDGGGGASINVTLGEFEYSSWRNGFITRHEMINLKSCEHLGIIPVKSITDFYNPNFLNGLVISESYSIITANAISTTTEFSYDFTSSIGMKIDVPGIEVNSEFKLTQGYTIESSVTYSYSTQKTITVSMDIDLSKAEGKEFCIGYAASTYKIECETWQYDDYWWGNYEVSGSRKSFSTYCTINPFITMIFRDGSVLLL